MKYLSTVFLIVLILGNFLSPFGFKINSAKAEDIKELSVAAPVNGTLAKDSSNEYTFTTNQDGELYAVLNQTTASFELLLYDSNGNKLRDEREDNPTYQIVLLQQKLPQGTYYLKLIPYTFNGSWNNVSSSGYQIKATYPGSFTRDPSTFEPNDTFETALPINDGQYYSSSLDSQTDQDVYSFTPNKDGEIYFTIDEATGGGCFAELYDQNWNLVTSTTLSGSGESFISDKVKQGTSYYIRITPYWVGGAFSASYRIKATYPGPINRDPSTFEPNDTTETAYPINLGVQYDSVSDKVLDPDVYQFTTEQDGNVSVELKNVTGSYGIQIYDLNNQFFETGQIDTSIGEKSFTLNDWARKGTYYIKIIPMWWNDGINSATYSFKATYLDNTPVVKSVADNSTAITGSAESNSTVYAYNGTTLIGSTITNDEPYFSMDIAKQKAGCPISVYTVDSSGVQSPSRIITVIDKTPPQQPTMNPVSNQTSTVFGTAEPNSMVAVWNGVIESGPVKAINGKYSIEIIKPRLNTYVYVVSTDAAGNSSWQRELVVAKAPLQIPTVNAISDRSTSITGSEKTNLKIYAYLGTKILGYTTANNGQFTIKIPKQKAGTTVSVFAEDSIGASSGKKLVKVLDKTPPAAPIVNNVKSKSTSITGKAEVYAKIYVYNSGYYLGSGNVTSKGMFSVKIKAQRKGTNLKVYAVDSSKNWSKAKIVKVI